MKTFLLNSKIIASLLICTIGVIGFSFQVNAQPLNGIYTIDPAGGAFDPGVNDNFLSFSEAVDTLISQGISGPVTINVATGTYDENFVITSIPGASAADTIVFQSASPDSSIVFLDFSGFSSSEQTMIYISGASYITFKHLSFITTQGLSTYGNAFALNSCHHINILNCSFTGKAGAGSSVNDRYALITGWGTDTEYLVFRNNRMNFGENAIKLSGVSSGDLARGLVIEDNIMYNQGDGAIYLRMFDAPLIRGNSITNAISGKWSIWLTEVDKALEITGNNITMNNFLAGMYIINCEPGPGAEGLIANNFVSSSASATSGNNNTGIWINNSKYLRIYHNTVKLTGGYYIGSSCIFQEGSGSTFLDIRNNSLTNFCMGYAINITHDGSVLESDFNNYFTNGDFLGKWSGAGRITLSDIVTASSDNASSISVDPVHPSGTGDLHTTNYRLEGKGTPDAAVASIVTHDIDGEPRLSPPDIGADEFTGAGTALSSGEYFVGGTAPDFETLTEAIDSLNSVGISGPVVFSLRDASVFAEQTSLYPVSGASPTNRVTFRSDPANATQAIISYSSTSSANYTFFLRRASYITIKNLNIAAENASYSTALRLSGYCHHDSIVDCTINSTGTAISNAGIYSTEHIHHDLYIGNNTLNSGYIGIYLNGLDGYGITNKDVIIDGNIIQGHYNQGVYLQDFNAPSVTGNMISDGTTNYNYWGINLSYCLNNYKILNNSVRYTGDDGGIVVSNCTGSLSFKGIIANNYVDMYGSNADAVNNIYTTYSTHVNVFFNTSVIRSSNTNASSNAYANTQGDAVIVKNNNLVNYSPGKAYWNDKDATITESDNNNLYTAGSYLGHWGSTDYSNIAGFQSASGGANNLNIRPWFLNSDSQHINGAFLDGMGTAIAGITTDMDGDIRSSPPDIGADEFDLIDGAPLIGGTYTIGGTAPDYNTIDEAIIDVGNRGVSGPVKFSIRNGNYEEYIGGIYQIPGANARDSVVFESESGNQDDVVIFYQTVSPKTSMFYFIGTDYFTLQNVTLSATGTAEGRPITMKGVTENINILNNKLISANTTWINLKISDGIQDSILIKGNYFSKGWSSIDVDGSSTVPATNLKIIDNYMTGASNKGIALRYCYAPQIISNTIVNSLFANLEGIELEYCTNRTIVSGNTIDFSNSGTGIYLLNSDAAASPFNTIVSNNMISMRTGNQAGTGIDVNGCDFISLLNNSVLTSSTYTNYSKGIIILDNSSDIEVINNVSYNAGTGTAFQVNNAANVTTSDYNSWYAEGTNLAYWNGGNYPDLASLQTASGKDANSISENPLFFAVDDLHSQQLAFHQKGTPLPEVSYDIDSVERDLVKPDLGAAEFFCVTPTFNVYVTPSCLGDSTIIIDSSLNIAPGSKRYWDLTGNAEIDVVTQNDFDAISWLFPASGINTITYLVQQIAGCNNETNVDVFVTPAPILNVTTKGAYCDTTDGWANVSVTNLPGPFNYFWSDGQTDSTAVGLAIGTYTVAVTNETGCTTTEDVTIGEAIEVTVSQINPSTCGIADGSASVSAVGGFAPYKYVWSNGDTTATNTTLSPGSHYVNVIDSKGCYAQGSINISSDGGPQVSAVVTHNECYGDRSGSVDISVSGGVTPYTYLWSNGMTSQDIDSLAAGIYNVTVEAADGCLGAGSFQVYQPSQISISPVVTPAACEGSDGKAVAVVSGGTKPYTYNWSSGGIFQIEEGLAAGVYSVTITDGKACKMVEPVLVSNIGAPVVTIPDENIQGVGCTIIDNGSINIDVSPPSLSHTYSWSTVDGSGIVAGEKTQSNLTAGTYKVTVTNTAGCKGVNQAIVMQEPPDVNPICLVTVDTASGMNMVVWEKIDTVDVSYYNIYRESSVKGDYQVIGSVGFNEESLYVDSVADPTIRSWRYRLSVVDDCGNESELSDPHKTMHLTMNVGVNETVNLIWDHYEGFPITTYEIWRYDAASTWTNISNMPSDLTSYTDKNPPTADPTYFIEVEHPDGCTSTDKKASTLNSSRSNRKTKLQSSAEGQAPTDISLDLSSIDENEPIGSLVGRFTTTDPDEDDIHSYSLATGTGDDNNSSFSISGDSLLSAIVFDYETKNSYSILVRTTDTSDLSFEKSFTITVNDVVEVGLNQILDLKIKIYPNPGTGVFNLSMDLADIDNVSIKIFDISGKLVMTREYENVPNRLETQLDLTEFSDGLYQIHVKSGNALLHRILIKE